MSETNTLITVNNPCLDRMYRINAWRDNNLTLSLVQGEGVRIPDNVDNDNPSSITVSGIKAPRLQLCDGSGIINLSNNPHIEWAILRPNGGEDTVTCNIKDAAQGIIEIPITTSATEYAGHIRGEIRLIADENGAVKFFGIDACVGIGVSDEAAEQSSRFSALLAALQKVVALDAGGEVATLDTVIDGQHTNPVASRVIYNYLVQNYSTTNEMNDAIADAISEVTGLSFQVVENLPPVKDAQTNVIYLVPTEQEGIYTQWVVVNNQWRQIGGTQAGGEIGLKKAYETDTPASIVGSNIYENDALDPKTLYQYYNKNGVYIGWMICAHTPVAMTAQLRFAYDGGLRVRVYNSGTWTSWNLLATKAEVDAKVPNTRKIAGIALSSDVSVASLKTALSVPDVSDKADKATTLAGYGIKDGMKLTVETTGTTIPTTLNQGQFYTNGGKVFLKNNESFKVANHLQLAAIGDIPTKTSDLTNDSGFLTSHQDISGKMDLAPEENNPSNYETITQGQLFKSQGAYFVKENSGQTQLAKRNDIPTVPSNVSAFQNDAGYLTDHQDISGKQDKQTSVPEVPTTEYHGSWIVDTSSSEFLALSIGHLFHSEFSEVLHTYQKTGEDSYIELSRILHEGDLDSVYDMIGNIEMLLSQV